MNLLVWLIGIRASAASLAHSGQTKIAGQLYLLADAIEAGRATEEHMRLVAGKLNSREINDADWDDAGLRIDEDSARLQSVPTPQ